MAISQTLSNALSGLTVASRGAEVTSSNIANAATEGYGTRELSLSARDVGGMGAGVRINGVIRHVDPVILGQRRLADAEVGHDTTLAKAAETVETLFGKTGEGTTLSDRVGEVEQALIDASADPSSPVRLEAAVKSLNGLVHGIDRAAEGIADLRQRTERDISTQVAKLNTALERVDELNDEITRLRSHGQGINGLVDQRQQIIDSISEIVPVKQLSRDGGRIALVTPAGETLVDHRARKVGFVASTAIMPEMTLAGGGLNGLTIDGDPVVGTGGAGSLAGGSLGAAFEVRDEFLPKAQSDLDFFTADLITRLSDPTVDGTIPVGGDGLIVATATYDPLDPVGLSGRIKVNPALESNPTLLRDGLGAVTPGPVANATLINGWRDALNADASGTSVAGRAAQLSADMTANRVRFEDNYGFASGKRDGLLQDELADAVDTDKEMQNLLRIEQAYAANARVIRTVESMMDRLMEI